MDEEIEKIIKFACAVVAEVCQHYQHALNIGSLERILSYLNKA